MHKFKDIYDVEGLPVITENLYSLVKEDLVDWYDGPLLFFAEYEGREVFVYEVEDCCYKVYELTEEGRISATDDHVPNRSKGEEWWDFLANENCIGVWYW